MFTVSRNILSGSFKFGSTIFIMDATNVPSSAPVLNKGQSFSSGNIFISPGAYPHRTECFRALFAYWQGHSLCIKRTD